MSGAAPECSGPFTDARDCPVHDPRRNTLPDGTAIDTDYVYVVWGWPAVPAIRSRGAVIEVAMAIPATWRAVGFLNPQSLVRWLIAHSAELPPAVGLR